MLNILSYIGVSLQSELCLWTLLGLIRTIFDATLFKVNANLKQVWQMSMPEELTMPVQRAMRTIISGVMLVQCFTVYVYLASYIVLLYPVFLEERPSLVLPWLLLAAVRKFLCELTSLALGLGACVLLGAARPPCIRFVVFKVASITPAFYMWMLVFSYYNTLKVASAFKRFPATLTMIPSDHDYGLELAVRRRRTKSLQDESLLRKKLVDSFNYGERRSSTTKPLSTPAILNAQVTLPSEHLTPGNSQIIQPDPKPPSQPEVKEPFLYLNPLLNDNLDQGAYEDWCGSEIIVPRDADRILEQFSVMMLRIAACINAKDINPAKLFSTHSFDGENFNHMDCSTPLQGTTAVTSPLVSTQGKTASYLQNYPQIFMKKASDTVQIQNESILNASQPQNIENVELKDPTLPLKISSAKQDTVIKDKGNVCTKVSKNGIGSYVEKKETADTSNNTTEGTETQASSKMMTYFEDGLATERMERQPMVSSAVEETQNPVLHRKIANHVESDRKIKNIDDDDNLRHKIANVSKSDSKIMQNKGELLKALKNASEDISSKSQVSNHSTGSQAAAGNMDTLDVILKRIKSTLRAQREQQQNRNTNETNNPNSTRDLNDANPK